MIKFKIPKNCDASHIERGTVCDKARWIIDNVLYSETAYHQSGEIETGQQILNDRQVEVFRGLLNDRK